jgi:hypothetical protein
MDCLRNAVRRRRAIGSGWLLVAAGALAIQSPAAEAQVVWNGTGTGVNWSLGANWVGGVAPTNGTGVVFTGTARTSNTDDISGLKLSCILFTNTATSFTLSGTSITLVGTGTILTQGSSSYTERSTTTWCWP